MSLILAAACIASVHDGDTVRLCSGERVRLANIDAPEVAGSPRCTARNRARLANSKNPPWCDTERGSASRDALRAFLSSGLPSIQRNGSDRYGRTLATLSVNGVDAGSYLIASGLAKPWR
ncbi:thermonuclease family protein [Novosphingobium guangzhouense]|uniref:Nuclease n=1 Tax=Novosphingobium guangzhouense TaxID=1850347 RepID=A0A2K2G671_9SPHN|nr:thermonuclease family protein [Novosphingobium guangzhouense]PNU06488.1 nuclease [Novosphingobium guangzhouense]